MPLTRRQHVINITHEVKSITGTETFISVNFINIHQRLWRSAEGEVTKIYDRTFPPYATKVTQNKDDLLSPIEIDSFSRNAISFLRLLTDFKSLNEFAELETRISAHLLDLVSNAKDEG
ncbi:hypothetical protein MRB53_012361 [Persea americana]|uniref:Uncharacterized protein n=1 Tax=Persea americana TaxID=3435 RepID=A0ACC2LXD1_PERAE|nr:hypothetical protein MRB53_012361 [Persea americana]